SGDLRRWETLLRTAGVWEVKSFPTANAKVVATQKTETSIYPGRLWKRRILRFALNRSSLAIIRGKRLRLTAWWRSKRWRTSWRGLVTMVMRDEVPFDVNRAFA